VMVGAGPMPAPTLFTFTRSLPASLRQGLKDGAPPPHHASIAPLLIMDTNGSPKATRDGPVPATRSLAQRSSAVTDERGRARVPSGRLSIR
jgi:hypothetical protein